MTDVFTVLARTPLFRARHPALAVAHPRALGSGPSRRDVCCGRFGRAPASTEKSRYGSLDYGMETTTLHATVQGRPTNPLRLSIDYCLLTIESALGH